MMAAIRAIAPFAAFVALWAIVVAVFHVPQDVMPSPAAVAAAFGDAVRKGVLTVYTGETIRRILIAASTGALIGMAAGFFVALNDVVAEVTLPVIRFFQSLSGIAWLPLFIVWFGFSDKTIVVAVWYTLFFPVLFNTVVGVKTVPRVYRNAILTLGGGWSRMVFDVLLPGAIPYIVGGIRIGAAFGWRVLIAAEIVIGAGGLGYFIFKAEAFHLTARIVAGMITIGTLWYLTDFFVLRPLEEATIERWGLVHR
ncbi:MAG TPA: ABC transporter permease [Candidatus Acidoferrales bacterium]|nr:ABC transporter permease [Candidatus Acidoferrales bacterium]